MTIAILCSAEQRQELELGVMQGLNCIWADSMRSLQIIEAEIFIDLLFEPDAERIRQLNKLRGLVVVNSVVHTASELKVNFARVAGWPTLLKRSTLEIALSADSQENLLIESGLPYTLVPDVKGLITPRIIAMIINEAYFALHEGVSSRENIDTAMKTGTNYPYGPFEWSAKIGESHIAELLLALNRTAPRYALAPHFENFHNRS